MKDRMGEGVHVVGEPLKGDMASILLHHSMNERTEERPQSHARRKDRCQSCHLLYKFIFFFFFFSSKK